jgi:hypothetical protein
VVRDPAAGLPELSGKAVYLCGDLSRAASFDLSAAARVQAIREYSHGSGAPLVGLGRVPWRVYGVGVYFRRFFDAAEDYFARVTAEHTFQSLTESTKPGAAHRTGIYLTPVRKVGNALHFRLLRCSTNLSGPTENFRATDRHIVDALNQEAALVFGGAAPLNHVLAQLYPNTPADASAKQTKAKISPHADKTKDMPEDGVMAFCTFYDRLDHLQPPPGDPFDRCRGTVSGLTRLRFRRKEGAPDELPAQFTITLYPGSVFFMPLSTNRLYTHEIQPSELHASLLPTRLGYVVRCSDAEAIHADGRTSLVTPDGNVELEAPTEEGMAELRRLYAEENKTTHPIVYGEHLRFSMNAGDYRAPNYDAADEFRFYTLPSQQNLYTELHDAVRFEELGKGRRGAVIVATDTIRGTPIVRTTTTYACPAQVFRPVHTSLVAEVRACASLAGAFNNALVEVYTNAYSRMGAHSDQAQDLDDAGEIALFSCYEHPDGPRRRLLVEPKSGGPAFAIPLTHHSVVVFSADTNRRFRHRIVLDVANGPDNRWLGVTFRTSKTFVHVRDGVPWFTDGTQLTLATEEERGELLRLRRRENDEDAFVWPLLTYTLSGSDRVSADEGWSPLPSPEGSSRARSSRRPYSA